MEDAQLQCEVEYEEADAASGRTKFSQVCARATVVKRRSGVEIVSESPPLRKAIKLANTTDRYELYFRFIADGKIAFIRRDYTRVYQFNLRFAQPVELVDLVRFCIRLGAIPKSPLSSLALTQQQSAQPPRSVSTGVKRSMPEDSRRPLLDRSNYSAVASSQREHKKPSKRQRTEVDPELTKDQRRVIDLIATRRNVFFTGSAGTGKSFLLQQILAPQGPLQPLLRGKRVFATATTGIAAYNIGGMTLHHFAGLDSRIDTNDVHQLVAHIKRKKDALARWRSVDLLVIDEISMLEGRLFDTLELLARELRPEKRNIFFGGIQLVLSGDFFQLPPVTSRNERDSSKLCFESAAWASGIQDVVCLDKVFRQTHTEFIDILNAFRIGKPSSAMIARLNQQYQTSVSDDASDAIRIFTHNSDVLDTNNRRLEGLAGRKYNYISADTGRAEYLTSCPAPASLSLKKNAQVLLIKSINPAQGLVNGCRGVVVGFTPQTQLPIVKFDSGATEIIQQEDFPVRVADTTLASRRQLPLALAWAISIHKSQGLAFPSAVLDLSRVFEYGQAYVALSRVRSLEGVSLLNKLDARRLLLADDRVLRFYEEINRRI